MEFRVKPKKIGVFEKILWQLSSAVAAPLTDAAAIQELSFWCPDYHIKNV